jgi:hypothetical protein
MKNLYANGWVNAKLIKGELIRGEIQEWGSQSLNEMMFYKESNYEF